MGHVETEGQEGGPSPVKGSSVLTFRRLHVPFLSGEADVDRLAFLP